ncbi:DUF1217 domain-containing protein [Palleronia sp. LCG004]|uniref:DUF1217 domain-containing protein n=1 Tax=Palleronia sp. LCG004 TaxID=3079304 RepID=UPI002943C4E9|nr:DUF1217 domain-containing protein [Palleronia sp. LCG004]WOI56197.1 DUF1217 domain-containing protein [Palleronia sp. LCG004]
MTFQPVVPFSGPTGWSFLQRTRETQQEAFQQSAVIKRNTDAFRERIGKIGSAEELVKDRQLLEVALGAFGLDEDINNKFLIEKMLTSDTTSKTSMTSRFADKRYETFSKAFGFGDPFGPKIGEKGFADRIVDAYNERQFEIAVGQESTDMRLAMGMSRDLEEITSKKGSADGAWFSVMANTPLRTVMETALGLPKSVGMLDLDQQLNQFRDRAQRVFGVSEVADFADPELQDKMRELYLIRAQMENGSGGNSPASIALSLLSS